MPFVSCRLVLAGLLALILVTGCNGPLRATQTTDRPILRFAVMGDSRHDAAAPAITPQDQRWLQNSKVLARLVDEVRAARPELLFFLGDMIYGYTTDRPTLERQYAYWRGMLAGLLEGGTYLVPVPGNHELQEKGTTADGRQYKLARPRNEQAWRDNMGDLIVDTRRWQELLGSPIAWDPANSPPLGGPDSIVTDQRQLSFSFDLRDMHFTVINTDAVGNDAKAPVAWLADDLARAKSRGASRFFIFGHRPAYSHKYLPNVENVGLDTFPANQQAFWDLVEGYRATYFCGHQHLFHASQPRAGQGGRSWQVIAGSGGSPFDIQPAQVRSPTDRTYAWVLVTVLADGRVRLEVFGFDEKFGPSKLLQSWELSAKGE
ncbi:MAG TPA: metallophosphoesterase [Geobacteraceae bacterium]